MINIHYSLLAALAPLSAAAVTLMLTRIMLASSVFTKIQDIPNARSLHDRPIPRIGGLAIMFGLLSGWYLLANPIAIVLYAGVIILLLISLLDDLRSIQAKLRLVVHLAVAVGFVRLGLPPIPTYLQALLVFGLVWMINIFNFMDGSNGLAGGMAVFGFAFYALSAGLNGDINFALMNLSIVASSLSFLFFNFGRARVFMGDAGSIPLGFLAAAMGLIGNYSGLWPLWFPVVIFSSFILDATATLLKRCLRGERFWEAHSEHYYQRVIKMGWSHQKTAIFEYGIMVISGFVALLSVRLTLLHASLLLIAFFSLMIFIMYLVDAKWRQYA